MLKKRLHVIVWEITKYPFQVSLWITILSKLVLIPSLCSYQNDFIKLDYIRISVSLDFLLLYDNATPNFQVIYIYVYTFNFSKSDLYIALGVNTSFHLKTSEAFEHMKNENVIDGYFKELQTKWVSCTLLTNSMQIKWHIVKLDTGIDDIFLPVLIRLILGGIKSVACAIERTKYI